MTARRMRRVGLIALISASACGGGVQRSPDSHDMGSSTVGAQTTMALERFQVDEGVRDNWLVRQGDVAAHLVVSSAPTPRLVVAFPAGNEGAAVWFDPELLESLGVEEPPEPVRFDDQRGVRFVLRTRGKVDPRHVVIGSVRTIRDFLHTKSLDARARVLGEERLWSARSVDGDVVTWRREHPDGLHRSVLVFAQQTPERLVVTATTNWEPLTPIPRDAILNDRGRRLLEQADGEQRRTFEANLDALAYLTYEEKLLAGSWRFATYFGRDTIMSLRLLAPVLDERVLQAGLRSVLDRVDHRGHVAHEEDIGGQAIFRHLASGDPQTRWTEMVLDYAMVDDNFMLPLLAAQVGMRGDSHPALERNRALVLEQAGQEWVELLPGKMAGDWRDSDEGLGGGRTSYSVNAALVPGALDVLSAPDELRERWRSARKAFVVRRTVEQVREAVSTYLGRLTEEEGDALRSLPLLPGGASTVGAFVDGGDAPALLRDGLAFHGVALDEAHRPIPVMNTDDGFMLLDLPLAPTEVEEVLLKYRLPFPLGLRSPAGVLVASAVYSDRPGDLEAFERTRYHGAVVWSWQHALLLVGLARTLERLQGLAEGADDEEERSEARRVAQLVRETLIALRDLDASLGELRGSELWTWGVRDGVVVPVPFGTAGHATESNAVQLWSTVGLGVQATLEQALSRDRRPEPNADSR